MFNYKVYYLLLQVDKITSFYSLFGNVYNKFGPEDKMGKPMNKSAKGASKAVIKNNDKHYETSEKFISKSIFHEYKKVASMVR